MEAPSHCGRLRIVFGLISILAVSAGFSVNSNSISVGIPIYSSLETETVDLLIRRSRSSEEPDFYEVSFRAFGEDRMVRLKRAEPVTGEEDSLYSSNFTLTTLDMDPQGRTLFEDNTPSKESINKAENNIYVDPESDTAVHIDEGPNGTFTLKGILEGRSIGPQAEGGSGVVGSANVSHTMVKAKIPSENDFVDVHRETKPDKGRSSYVGIPRVLPEVFIVLDFDNTQLHNGDVRAIMDYLTVLFKSINNRFATLKDTMQIEFKISGLITVKSYNAQPFIESNPVLNGKGYDIIKILDSFSKWLYSYQRNVPAHDLAALITGKDMYTLDAGGKYTDGVTGYAYVKGACWVNDAEKKYMGTSVTEDIGGYWYGVFSIAHEFAHNLGAPHDGQAGGGQFQEPSTLDCPWSQGYMMSYEGWGSKSKFYFSKCSARLMKDFLVSDGSLCMKFQHANSNWKESTRDVGDKLSMKAMCVKYTKKPDAYVDPTKTPDDLCKNLSCRYPNDKGRGSFNWVTLNHPPGDNVPCAKGKRCMNGECVAAGAAVGK